MLFLQGEGQIKVEAEIPSGWRLCSASIIFSRVSISCTYLEKLHFCWTGLFDPVPQEGENVPHHSRTQPGSLCRSQSFKSGLCRQICARNDPGETASGLRDCPEKLRPGGFVLAVDFSVSQPCCKMSSTSSRKPPLWRKWASDLVFSSVPLRLLPVRFLSRRTWLLGATAQHCHRSPSVAAVCRRGPLGLCLCRPGW